MKEMDKERRQRFLNCRHLNEEMSNGNTIANQRGNF